MKKLAALLLVAAACGPGLVEFPVVPVSPGQTPGGGGNTPPPPPQTPADCAATQGTVLCGTQCVPLGPTNCGLNTDNGFCQDCTQAGPGFTCSAGVCVPPTTCAAGLVVCASGCCTATQVVAGGNTSCAIVTQISPTASTGVYCWGANDSGQLGPAGSGASSGIATEIAALRGATAVAIGSGHGCAIMADKSVMCWGKNDAGQLGVPASSTPNATPVPVPQVSGATAIAVGDHHSCAITAAGAVCWGATDQGQLGDASLARLTTGASKIVAGANHTCAMLPASVVCWGANESGQIGNGTQQPSALPFTVPLPAGATTVVDVAAGSNHSCAIVSGTNIDGTKGVICWGRNDAGQTNGLGTPSAPVNTSPVAVKAFSSPKLPDAVAAGRAHTCYRRGTDGSCFGDNSLGQISISATPNLGGPISAGGDHTCYIDASTPGEIHCFGRNLSSELGPFGP